MWKNTAKRFARDKKPHRMIIDPHGAVAIDPKAFLNSETVQNQIAAARALREASGVKTVGGRAVNLLGGMVLDIAIDLVANAKQICTGEVDWQKPKERWTAALKFALLLGVIACFLFALNPWVQGVMIVAIIFNKITLLLLDKFK